MARIIVAQTVFVLFTTVLTGCSSVDSQAGWQNSSALTAIAPLDKSAVLSSKSVPKLLQGEADKTSKALHRLQAIKLALQGNPQLRAEARQVRSWESRRVQAGRWANPNISLSAEDWLGNASMRGIDELQFTAEISQSIDIGGRHASLERVAATERDAAGWQLEMARIDIYYQAGQAFDAVLIAQARLALNHELADLARQVERVLKAQLGVGKVTELEVDRAIVAVALADMDVQGQEIELSKARRKLASLWGDSQARFTAVAEENDAFWLCPDETKIATIIESHPRVLLKKGHVVLQKARVDAARSQAIPDINVSLGYRYFNLNQSSALVSGLAFALPVFDRNRAELDARLQEQAAAKELLEAERVLLLEKALRSAERLRGGVQAREILTQKVIPQAEKNFLAMQEGARIGRYGYLDLLDAQRSLFRLKRQEIDLKAEVLSARAELELYLAKPLREKDAEQTQIIPTALNRLATSGELQ